MRLTETYKYELRVRRADDQLENESLVPNVYQSFWVFHRYLKGQRAFRLLWRARNTTRAPLPRKHRYRWMTRCDAAVQSLRDRFGYWGMRPASFTTRAASARSFLSSSANCSPTAVPGTRLRAESWRSLNAG